MIRGQAGATHIGATDGDGRVYLLPIQHWTKSDLLTYLQAHRFEVSRQYDDGMASPDCLLALH